MIPKVAIIGRPNVGKSTLFNRLIRERKAIESEIPGTTRDVLQGLVDFESSSFELFDMAGYIPESVKLTLDTQKKILDALEFCDLVLFIVDVKEGLCEQDKEIARVLKKKDKPVILVINKADDLKKIEQVGEFSRLGFKNSVEISAIHGRNITKLLEEIIKVIPQSTAVEEIKATNIAIIGRPNVGKSSIFNAIIQESRALVHETPGTTRDTIDSILKFDEEILRFIDTAGLRRKGKRRKEILEALSVNRAEKGIGSSSIVILIVDAEEGVTRQDLHLVEYVEKYSTGLLVVVNKCDLIKQEEKKLQEERILQKLGFLDWAPVVFVSAKTGENIPEILEFLKKIIKSRQIKIDEKELSKFLEDILKQKEPVPQKGRKPIKITKIWQIKINPPTFMVESNDPRNIHFSYKRYLKNRLRERFSLLGTEMKIQWQKRE